MWQLALGGSRAVGPSVRKLVNQTCAICNAGGRANQPRKEACRVWIRREEGASRDKFRLMRPRRAGIRTRVQGIMMMYMAWPAVQGLRRINLTAAASRSMDGWEGEHRAQQRAPREKLRSPNPGPSAMHTPARGHQIWRHPLPPQAEYRVQGATTHQADRRAHTHLGTQSHMLPGVQPRCNQRTGQYNDTQGPSLLARSIVAARSTSTNDSGSCREFLSRAPAPAQGLSSQTVEPQSDDTRPVACAPAGAACFCCLPATPPACWLRVCRSGSRCVLSAPVACRVRTQPSRLFHLPSVFPRAGRATSQRLLERERWYRSGCILLTLMQPPDCFTHTGTHTRTQAPPNLDFTRSSHKRSGQGDWPASLASVVFSNKTPRAAQPLVRSGSTTVGGR